MPYPYNAAYPYYSYQQFQPTQSYSNTFKTMEWVDGEVGAKAYQMPQGLAPETPIVLWDSTEKKIFLKSWNQMGMANPLQELDYEIKERTNPALLPANLSGDANNYVTKEDLSKLKEELRSMIANINNNNRNRGGNQ